MTRRMVGLVILLLAGCSNGPATERALRSQGFTAIQTHGWGGLRCGEDDGSATGFTAVNPTGQTVSGVVCCGWFFKGCTVRW